jgi:hypothetical protein
MSGAQLTLCAGLADDSLDASASSLSKWLASCPVDGCRGKLSPYPSPQSSYDSVTGLNHIMCGTCGHEGMQVPNGLYLVFRGPDEYVFHHAPSLASLTIVASPSFLTPFTWHGFSRAQVVTFVAGWILLTGRSAGTVELALEPAALEDCYHYFCRQLVQGRGVQIA